MESFLIQKAIPMPLGTFMAQQFRRGTVSRLINLYLSNLSPVNFRKDLDQACAKLRHRFPLLKISRLIVAGSAEAD